jgi:hypothetical protein
MKTEYRKSSVHIYKIEGDTACSVLAYSYFEKGETISISYVPLSTLEGTEPCTKEEFNNALYFATDLIVEVIKRET